MKRIITSITSSSLDVYTALPMRINRLITFLSMSFCVKDYNNLALVTTMQIAVDSSYPYDLSERN
jgi:hypothetical protein